MAQRDVWLEGRWRPYPDGDVSFHFLHFTQQGGNQGGLATAHVAHHCQQRALRHQHVNTANTKSSLRRVDNWLARHVQTQPAWLRDMYLCRTGESSLAHVNFPLTTVTENSVKKGSHVRLHFECAHVWQNKRRPTGAPTHFRRTVKGHTWGSDFALTPQCKETADCTRWSAD